MASPADPNRATNDLLRRVPPHSVEAEQAVLGGIFIRNSVFHTLVDTLSSDDFYLPAHQTLYTCFLELYRKNAPIDLVSVASYLKDHGQLEAVGGAAYLSELAQTVVSGANAEYYSTIVRDKSLQRSLIGACSDIISNCFDQSRSVDALLDESEQAVFSISERTSGKVFKSSKELVNRVFEELTKRFEQKEAVTGVTTGYNRLDQMTAGSSLRTLSSLRPSLHGQDRLRPEHGHARRRAGQRARRHLLPRNVDGSAHDAYALRMGQGGSGAPAPGLSRLRGMEQALSRRRRARAGPHLHRRHARALAAGTARPHPVGSRPNPAWAW